MTESTVRPVTRRSESSTTEFGLKATRQWNILSAKSISFRNKVNERVRAILNRSPGNELGEVERRSLILGIVYDFFNARSDLSWKRLLRQSALRQKYRKETQCTDVVRRESKVGSRRKFEDVGSNRIKPGKVCMGEADPGGRRRGDQAHEGKTLRIL